MKKYQTGFKLKMVKSFMAGDDGAKLLARQWSVPEEKIRTRVSHYRLHGIDGLRPKRTTYSAHFKLLTHPGAQHFERIVPTLRPTFALSGARPVIQILSTERVFDFLLAPMTDVLGGIVPKSR